jgi:hypothetical protein
MLYISNKLYPLLKEESPKKEKFEIYKPRLLEIFNIIQNFQSKTHIITIVKSPINPLTVKSARSQEQTRVQLGQ